MKKILKISVISVATACTLLGALTIFMKKKNVLVKRK
ncbi:hypothetical protein ATF84_12428 [[Clostridium] innocuum]|nr:hypothetical protein ATF84_12428 [[Clostridium] innocuum]SSA49249.1 hypothetical protein SAMN04487929_12428 [[Clostridium] innocuum]